MSLRYRFRLAIADNFPAISFAEDRSAHFFTLDESCAAKNSRSFVEHVSGED